MTPKDERKGVRWDGRWGFGPGHLHGSPDSHYVIGLKSGLIEFNGSGVLAYAKSHVAAETIVNDLNERDALLQENASLRSLVGRMYEALKVAHDILYDTSRDPIAPQMQRFEKLAPEALSEARQFLEGKR